MNRSLDSDCSPDSTWVSWLKLVRIPNSFTVIADVLAGSALALGSWRPEILVSLVVVATLFFYWSGMILNDVFDLEKDRLQHRNRPLVLGSISVRTARRVAYGLMLVGLLVIFVAIQARVFLSSAAMDPATQAFVFGPLRVHMLTAPLPLTAYSTLGVAAILAILIWLYDGPLKATFAGPLLMGLCRVFSLLMGISIGWWNTPIQPWYLPHLGLAAVGHGVFVMGITWAARREAESKQNANLPLGWCCSLIGIAMLAAVSAFAPSRDSLRVNAIVGYPIAISLLALPWARRALDSILNPSPATIQRAVKQAIMSIIFFDAMLVLQFAGPWHAIVVCALIFPAMFLGKKFKST
jgi:UbiA prenyltransferase family